MIHHEKKIEERLKGHIERIAKKPGITTRELREGCEGVTLRTIQNDLKYLMKHWDGGRLWREGRGYHVELFGPLEETAWEREKRIYLKLALEATKEMNDLAQSHDEIVRDLGLDRMETPYYVKAENYEELDTDDKELREMEEAIEEDHPVLFRYRGKLFHVAPLRLVNFDGIWYLYGKDLEERDENPWKTWLLAEIEMEEVDYSRRHGIPDEEVEEDLEEAPSPHFIPDREIGVRLRVAEEIAELFRAREYLPDQRILGEEPDGSLRVEGTVSTYEDLEREVKAWLPHVEILSPGLFRERLLEELRRYLQRMEASTATPDDEDRMKKLS